MCAIKVTVLSESRADYGIYYPLLKALQRDTRLELQLRVAETSLQWGLGGEIKFNWCMIYSENDWLIVLGDRRPMLEAAIEAAYKNIPIAHIYGGDRTGTIDDPCRHAITRFAHLHFPCTQQSAERLVRMGEQPWRIKIVGPLGVYAMPDAQFIPKVEIGRILGLEPGREIVIVIQHPVSTQIEQAGEQMRVTLEAVKGLQAVVIYPNTDPGSEAMIEVIEGCDWVYKCKSLPYLEFLSLLKACDVIVGNSSCGLYEAPHFGIPAVNIGSRQQKRERGHNVYDVPHDGRLIRSTIDRAIIAKKDCFSQGNPFDNKIDGINIILDTLANTTINERLLQKELTY